MMDDVKKIAVVIPFHKQKPTAHDLVALQQCFKVLAAYPVIVVKPQKLALPRQMAQYPFSSILSFADDYFSSIQGYNRLMMDELFYSAFLDYDYILIYQLDAFVFRDELPYWCSQGIDYVGAPWLRKKDYPNGIKAAVSKALQYLARRYNIKKHGLPGKKQFDDNVGNGGFSLRRVAVFHELCLQYRDAIAVYNSKNEHQYNEDVFWSIELNRKRKVLSIPDYKKALQFAFELAPERAYRINHQQLPFGCHAWDLYMDFWRPVFKEYGYNI